MPRLRHYGQWRWRKSPSNRGARSSTPTQASLTPSHRIRGASPHTPLGPAAPDPHEPRGTPGVRVIKLRDHPNQDRHRSASPRVRAINALFFQTP